MDSVSMNQYEKQLYSVFKTFDVNDDEALDRPSIQALCDALQLEERGATLTNALFEGRAGRVTFAQFRNGLLDVLGDSGEAPPACAAPEPAKTTTASPLSDDDSSGREVAPKFVFGSKKYGRRSRPRGAGDGHDGSRSPRASSASRLETAEKRAGRKARCRRSASVMDAREDSWASEVEQRTAAPGPGDFDHDRRIGRDEAYALCRGLHLDAVDGKLIDSIFAESPTAETTVGDFFERLNISLTSSIQEVSSINVIPSHEQNHNSEPNDAIVATEVVLEALDAAGVPQARRLLLELGFADESVRPSDIEQALEDEIRALVEPMDERRDARALLLGAALAVGRLRLELARQTAEVVVAERDKLRNDLAEANKRAGLLAQEVDESHACIENELKASLKRMEARHAEALRTAAAEHSAERDRAAQQRTLLEAEVARRAEAEGRLRADVSSLRARIEEAESRAMAAEERTSLLETEQSRLIAELQVERERSGEAAESGRGAAGELAARVDELRAENKVLRDRNDELCAELEVLSRQMTASNEVKRKHVLQEGDLSTELHCIFQQGHSEECDSSPISMDQKVLGYAEAVQSLRDIFDSILTLPSSGVDCKCANTVASLKERIFELCETVVLPSPSSVVPGLIRDVEVQTDSNSTSMADVDQLKRELLETQSRHEDEQQKLSSLVKDLEASLEQMKLEYDKCEEYWSAKVEEERAAFGEEQRLGDERLAELAARIGDYERQFAHAHALPTIPESGLEAQAHALHEEFAQYRKEKQAELAEKEREIARLRGVAEARERRAAPAAGAAACAGGGCACAALLARCRRLEAGAAGGAGAAEAREMRARTARAEAAVRRLQARLAAADLLVKDLYVENCHLAHRTHI